VTNSHDYPLSSLAQKLSGKPLQKYLHPKFQFHFQK
jgi:hypothetical protein